MPTKRMTSLQCRACPQTCQPASPIATNGTRVTSPVMIRSRVSFSTGCMSVGRGPTLDIRGDHRQAGLSRAAKREGGIGSRQCAWRRQPPCAARSRHGSPNRPFDGRVLGWEPAAGHRRRGGPTFRVRSPRAAAHVLRAPGQLGLGRAYVSGELEVDDIDAVIELLDSWKPPPLEGADKARLLLGAVRAAGPHPAAAAAGGRAAPERPPPLQGARRACGPPPLRRLQRVLRALPRRVDDLQLRGLRATGRRPSRRRRRRSSRWSAASWRSRRATACSTSAAAGAASRSGRRRNTAPSVVGITLSPPQAETGARSGPRRPASPTGSRSG